MDNLDCYIRAPPLAHQWDDAACHLDGGGGGTPTT
jgi:3'-phosphoadenosine 5'-phosphosulfate (PAPS) 3'-phosphatase